MTSSRRDWRVAPHPAPFKRGRERTGADVGISGNLQKHWENIGKISWENIANHGNILGKYRKSWEYPGKMWENHGRFNGQLLEIGNLVENYWKII